MRSEARNNDYLDGSAVAKNFGADKGDTVSYVIPPEERMAQGVITLRYRLKQNARVTFQLKGISDQKVTLIGTGKFELAQIPFSDGANGDSRLILESEGGSGVELNGFFIGPSTDSNRIDITQTERKFAPEVIHGDSNNLILKYRDIDDYYGIAWDFSPSVVREFLNDELDIFFRMKLQNHVDKTFVGNKLGHYENVFLRPIELSRESERTVYALICNGSRDAVQQELSSFSTTPAAFKSRLRKWRMIIACRKENLIYSAKK